MHVHFEHVKGHSARARPNPYKSRFAPQNSNEFAEIIQNTVTDAVNNGINRMKQEKERNNALNFNVANKVKTSGTSRSVENVVNFSMDSHTDPIAVERAIATAFRLSSSTFVSNQTVPQTIVSNQMVPSYCNQSQAIITEISDDEQSDKNNSPNREKASTEVIDNSSQANLVVKKPNNTTAPESTETNSDVATANVDEIVDKAANNHDGSDEELVIVEPQGTITLLCCLQLETNA